MAELTINQSGLGNGLMAVMGSDELQPGDPPSYEICKNLYLFHPLGGKIAESPVRLAQSQDREITVESAEGIEEMLVDRFKRTWGELDMSAVLLNLRTQARVYGLASVGIGERGADLTKPIDLESLWKADIYLNVFDPLNTPGLIIDQNPNSPNYQKFTDVRVNGVPWHRSRTKTAQNEFSIYLAWTSAAYAYAGRSIYQRALYPLKSYIDTMIVNAMVARKAGLLVAKQEQPGSVVDGIMAAMAAFKRFLLKLGGTNQVISISTKEDIESLNLQNIDGALREARNNIIKDIAVGVDCPAKLLTQEAFVEGFGEGTEDARTVASYIDRLRIEMAPEYAWADTLVQYRAWTPEWYKTVQKRFPDDFSGVPYKQAFYQWRNKFTATWPSLIREEPSELVTIDDVKLKASLAMVQILAPILQVSPELTVELVRWAQATVNVNENLFQGEKLDLDLDVLLDALEQQRDAGGGQGDLEEEENAKPQKPFSSHDSAAGVAFLKDWTGDRRSVKERLLALNGGRQ